MKRYAAEFFCDSHDKAWPMEQVAEFLNNNPGYTLVAMLASNPDDEIQLLYSYEFTENTTTSKD